MIKVHDNAFHLYFAGVQRPCADDLIEEQGNYRLLSYLNDKKAIQRRMDKGLKTFVDSGAFSAHTLGKEIDIDEYIKWLNEHDEFISIAAELDHIPGTFGKPKTKEQLTEAPEISWENYVYMAERVNSWEKILPIFHHFEDFKHLERMLEHKPKIPYIGLSPSNEVGVPIKKKWLEECFKVIKNSSNPNVNIHAFGMTSFNLLEMFPFKSADSTSWLMTSANGNITTKYGIILVSENGKGKKGHIDNKSKSTIEHISEYVEKFGFNLDELKTDYKERSKFNIAYMTEWANNYKYSPTKVKQKTLF